MAEEHDKKSYEHETRVDEVETKDRGLFDFLGKKKEEKPQDQEALTSEFEKISVSEPKYEEPKYEEPVHAPKYEEPKYEEPEPKFEEPKYVPEPEPVKVEELPEEKKHSLLEKLHRSDSSSSSSSDEEGEEGIEKKKKKKGLKEKIAGEDKKKSEDTTVPIEKYDEPKPVVQKHHNEPEPLHAEPPLDPTGEKKGFLEKIKEKLPHKKSEETALPYPTAPAPTPAPVEHHHAAVEGQEHEKKGILEKIKDKLPGFHSKSEEEIKEKEKEKEKEKVVSY